MKSARIAWATCRRPLSPSDTLVYWWMTGLAAAQFALRRYEDAIASARSAVQRHPSFGSAHRLLAASLALAGKLDEARDVTNRRDRVQTTTLREIGALQRWPAAQSIFLVHHANTPAPMRTARTTRNAAMPVNKNVQSSCMQR